MERCINSILKGGEEVEILIVDDGSTKDNTAEIADRYEREYPRICKAIHKENGGHGSGVNTGLAHASGLYFKVVDSDDWVNTEAYQELLARLRRFAKFTYPVDMVLTNYTYEHVNDGTCHHIRYRGKMPCNRVFMWEEMGRLRPDQNILMHAVIYRTELLRQSKMKLPEHCYYVDNIFVYEPLPWVKRLYYMDIDFYCYFIGREDQSVNEANLLHNIDQQLTVTYHMLSVCNPMERLPKGRLRTYMLHYLAMMVVISSVFLVMADTEESERKRRRLWDDIYRTDPRLYRKLHYQSLGAVCDVPVLRNRRLLLPGYRLAQRIFKFN